MGGETTLQPSMMLMLICNSSAADLASAICQCFQVQFPTACDFNRSVRAAGGIGGLRRGRSLLRSAEHQAKKGGIYIRPLVLGCAKHGYRTRCSY